MRLNEYGLAPISHSLYIHFRSKLPRMWTTTMWFGRPGIEHRWDSDMEHWAFMIGPSSGVIATLKFPKGMKWDSPEAHALWIQKLIDLNKEHFGETA